MRVRSRRAPEREEGAILVAAIVLIALLFFVGTVMALAVESNLQTVRQIGDQDAVQYAAESAVAQGLASRLESDRCRDGSGTISELGRPLPFSFFCHEIASIDAAPDKIRHWAFPGQTLAEGQSIVIEIRRPGTVWTVIGWRNAGAGGPAAPVSIEPAGKVCPGLVSQTPTPGLTYFCRRTEAPSIMRVGGSGPVTLGPFVVRAVGGGSDKVATVIGRSGSVAQEADLLFPKRGEPAVGVRGTVLP